LLNVLCANIGGSPKVKNQFYVVLPVIQISEDNGVLLMPDIEDFRPSTKFLIERKLVYGKKEFALHFLYIEEQLKTKGIVQLIEFRSFFGLAATRASEIFQDFKIMELINEAEIRGNYVGVKNGNELKISKYKKIVEDYFFK
jgi:hypothetical protein